MLFSEPKIPQSGIPIAYSEHLPSFSALQRAENSSMLFGRAYAVLKARFSALQRAENSSIVGVALRSRVCGAQFQCSSASRKFLNAARARTDGRSTPVSVLFSEPKIPQCFARLGGFVIDTRFSALQRAENSSIESRPTARPAPQRFSALQRAENSSIVSPDSADLL